MFASSISRPWLCVFDTIVLSNGCFDINPVLCPSYKHCNMECVWGNHPFIYHLLVVFYILVYWLILNVLLLVVFYTLVYWLIKVSWNGCFDINPSASYDFCHLETVLTMLHIYIFFISLPRIFYFFYFQKTINHVVVC
jgi:hypothetical protein